MCETGGVATITIAVDANGVNANSRRNSKSLSPRRITGGGAERREEREKERERKTGAVSADSETRPVHSAGTEREVAKRRGYGDGENYRALVIFPSPLRLG